MIWWHLPRVVHSQFHISSLIHRPLFILSCAYIRRIVSFFLTSASHQMYSYVISVYCSIAQSIATRRTSNSTDFFCFDRVVCAVSSQTRDIVHFTSCRSRGSSDLFENTKIWEAARATSAASSFFKPISLGIYGEEFVDGATGANNPARELWKEAKTVWPEMSAESVKCLVSIGTGMPSRKPFGSGSLEIAKTLKDIATETEKTAESFQREHSDLDDSNRYFRFNVLHRLENIGLEAADKAKEIMAATRRYANSQDVFKKMRLCGHSITTRRESTFPTA